MKTKPFVLELSVRPYDLLGAEGAGYYLSSLLLTTDTIGYSDTGYRDTPLIVTVSVNPM